MSKKETAFDLQQLPRYFEVVAICNSCNTRTKGQNQITCTQCHEESMDGRTEL